MTNSQEQRLKLLLKKLMMEVKNELRENISFADVKQELIRIQAKFKDDMTGPEKSAAEVLKYLIKIGLIDKSKFRPGTV